VGFAGPAGSGTPIRPDLVLIDAGWEPQIAHQFVAESGPGRYWASRGLGTARGQGNWTQPRAAKGRTIGNEWYLNPQADGTVLLLLHADHWKRAVHDGFAAPPTSAGSLQIYHADPKEHIAFARQILAETCEEEFLPGKGIIQRWRVLHRNNHWLDCAAGARCAADMVGIRLVEGRAPAPRKARVQTSGRGIRTKYRR